MNRDINQKKYNNDRLSSIFFSFSLIVSRSHIGDVEPVRSVNDNLLLVDGKAIEALLRVIKVLLVVVQNFFFHKVTVINTLIKELSAIILKKELSKLI